MVNVLTNMILLPKVESLMMVKVMGVDGECSHRHATAFGGGEFDDGDGDDDEGGD